jgi:hypothetical protein
MKALSQRALVDINRNGKVTGTEKISFLRTRKSYPLNNTPISQNLNLGRYLVCLLN